MSTTISVPDTIALEAPAFVNRLGQRHESELMIERAKRSVRGLSLVTVALDELADDTTPGVNIWTHRDDIGTEDDPRQQRLIEWMAATCPPGVRQNFVLLPFDP